MRDMRVRSLRLRPDGVWEQDGGPTDEELEREVQEAKRMVARIFQRPLKKWHEQEAANILVVAAAPLAPARPAA